MLKLLSLTCCAAVLASSSIALAQDAAPKPEDLPFAAGMPVGIVDREGAHTPASDNVKVFGAIVSAESCSYDETRNLVIAVNRGAPQNRFPNDGFVSLINHDGSVHTPRWIGANRNGLTLNEPFGSDIHEGILYLADSDGGTAEDDPRTAVIRKFDIATGAPVGEVPVAGVAWLNDIEVASDGTIYGSDTGMGPAGTPQRIFKVTPDGETSVFLEGAPLALPNGVGIDNDGNIVIANMGDDAVLTFSVDGELLNTEKAAQPGSDGLVIMADGTKYVSSVMQGGISKMVPGAEAELIATSIPSAASMCYDAEANQLVVPLNNNNGLAFVPLS
ncbi:MULTISPECIES: SMP-30/gluconolactonase/LRE family protein [unclassified Devosia]|uniref:SMP-30/gluconolactonase/LRE family protein n=1 Tax=unclassified Devosia TaxID=196773 RepID=UPI00145D09A0|nr:MULTISPECIES: SMP-30/gluconolactonase/LRE family protein [unclassified Devosia]MBJ6987850.1 SMP-30/gluconolactonase/LRE family protein [Devosia sp. MC521]QMW63755.1 SMP-30/gluconolactonase/LRE family protein [Devosia sp. MC521]